MEAGPGRETLMDLSIRRATPDDAEAVAGLLNPIIDARIYTALDTPKTVGEMRSWIAEFGPRAFACLAHRAHGGLLVGFQTLDPLAPHTYSHDHVATMGTYVALGHHRQGIAARMFAATYESALALGYEKIFTFIRADNTAGLRAYAGQGFAEVGRAPRQTKIDGHYIDEVIVEKWLLPSHAGERDG